jgi:hypothetical protein
VGDSCGEVGKWVEFGGNLGEMGGNEWEFGWIWVDLGEIGWNWMK